MVYDTILVEKEKNIAILMLNRPDTFNAWNQQMAEESLDALNDIKKDDDVAVVIITGMGKAFSSGADAIVNMRRPAFLSSKSNSVSFTLMC